jgi:hypothetical protein
MAFHIVELSKFGDVLLLAKRRKGDEKMRPVIFVIVVFIFWLATCSVPEPPAPAAATATLLPTQTSVPATATPLPPTVTSIPQGKLPEAPFDADLYASSEAGFALDYPRGWTVNEMVVGPRGTQVQFLSRPDLAEAATVPAGETRLSAMIYQWDPKNDLPAYIQHMKDAWTASGFSILEEQDLTLEQGLPAARITIQTPDAQVVYLVAALKDQYLVIAGEGNLDLVKQIVERVRPIS